MNLQRVKNESVWADLKLLFTTSMLLFLINIFFGFDNALTIGDIPRWQVLIHLHGGSIGWITLSAVGIAIWHVTNTREVDAAYEKKVHTIILATVIAFSGYVPSFGLAFSRADALVYLLPIFGIFSVTMLWIAAVFTLKELKNQEVVYTVQILSAGALLVAAIGGTVGALLGLERAIGQFAFWPVGADRVGAHAGMMDTYLFLVAAAIIEWFSNKDYQQRRTTAGLLQGVIWAVGAAIVPIAVFIDKFEELLPIFMLSLLIGLGIFLFRTAWGALKVGPNAEGVKPWAFFGTVWLITYISVFMYFISVFIGGGSFESVPPYMGVLFAHAGFVGMMTNLIIGVLAVRTWEKRDLVSWGDKTALWTINLGILLFVYIKATSDSRLGAIVMGVGILVGVYTMFTRLRASEA
ncbi:MAG: hypothetical protein N2D54_06760 [Chloroflexota bacterium]